MARALSRTLPPLGHEAASSVRDLVISGEPTPGSPVRPEAIATELGISSTPAREALEVEGFLNLAPRRGFTVVRVTGDDIRDIFLVQSSVAGEVAARAARQITPMQIARLEEIHDAVIETVARAAVETLEELNHQFHRAINLAVHSPKLVLVIQILARDTPRCFYATKDCDCSRNCPDTTVEDHGVLLDAMRCACDAVAPRSGGAIAHQIMFDARPSYRRASRRD